MIHKIVFTQTRKGIKCIHKYKFVGYVIFYVYLCKVKDIVAFMLQANGACYTNVIRCQKMIC